MAAQTVNHERLVGWDNPAWGQTNVTFRQVDYWSRNGYLRSDDPTPGSGRPRRWPISEVQVAGYVKRLQDCGFNLQAAFTLARDPAERERVVAVIGSAP